MVLVPMTSMVVENPGVHHHGLLTATTKGCLGPAHCRLAYKKPLLPKSLNYDDNEFL